MRLPSDAWLCHDEQGEIPDTENCPECKQQMDRTPDGGQVCTHCDQEEQK